MPVIKVWCLPKSEEEKLNQLHQSIVQAVVSVEELGVKSEKDITCLFPTDMMEYGLGTEIIVEVTGLYEKPDRTDEVRQRLAERIGQAVQEQFPGTKLIECFVYPFKPSQGVWTSRK
jgi:phenylpyruvate tautomerase PptA (4-oxalocrotonate tautomerase family)